MMDIPYTVERRPDTGVNNVVLGTWLFLASEVMLFGGLFSAYILLRSGADSWPQGASVSSLPLGLLNTIVLLASSVTIAMARRAAADPVAPASSQTDPVAPALGQTDPVASASSQTDPVVSGFSRTAESKARTLLAVTALLALAFLGIKGVEYASKLSAGLYPATSTFLAVYYLLTSVHAVHVLGGLVVIGYFAAAGSWSTDGSRPRFANRIASLTLYWHFVDAVWICLFVMLYLL